MHLILNPYCQGLDNIFEKIYTMHNIVLKNYHIFAIPFLI